MAALVQRAFHDGVVTLTLNRPEKLNALGAELLEQLLGALHDCATDEQTRAIVLTGSGSAFSGGGDVGWFNQVLAGGGAAARDAIGRLMEDYGNPVTQAIAESAKPVVAAVNGPCVGGAVGIALACDVVLVARSAYFLVPQAPQLGVVPDLGATWSLARILGRSRALGMVLLGDRITAERAEQWGLVWRCVDDAELLNQATSLAGQLTGIPEAALRDTRDLIDAASMQPLVQQLNAERSMQRQHVVGDFFNEACARFARRVNPS